MGNKIGRNEKCTCGSGKKYKRCCLHKDAVYGEKNHKKSQTQKSFLRSYFQNYHNIDLAVTLASLSIYPPNHGKNLRLEYLTLEALTLDSHSDVAVNTKNLSSFLDKHFGSHHLEDPPGNLFTENVISSIGNNTVYGGNFEQGAFTLNNIINAINFKKDVYPDDFLKITNDAFLLLLKMSDLVAGKLRHKRNMLGGGGAICNEIEFPENITEFKDALVFHNKWFDNFCNHLNIDKGIATYFSLNHKHRNNTKNEVADTNNPLITKPLIQWNNGFLLISPTNIISALVHFTLVQAARYGCQKELIFQFHETVWDELIFSMDRIEFEKEIFNFENKDNLPVKSLLFRFDTNKLAYLNFSYDEGESYDKKTPFHSDPMKKIQEAIKLKDKNFKLLNHKYKDYKFIDLTLYSFIGREYPLKSTKRNNTNVLIASVYQFLCWLKSDLHDSMSLWYFLESKKKLLGLSKLLSHNIGFLNCYNLYKNKNKSFYLGDERKPDFLLLTQGELNVIKDATENEDKIAVYYKIPKFEHCVFASVVKFDNKIPRYFDINRFRLGYQFEFYLPGYPIDIWIRAKNNLQDIPEEDFDLYSLFSMAISYWFWLIKEQLKLHLKQLEIQALLISYELTNTELFESQDYPGKKEENVADKFTCSISENKIEIKIPSEISSYINSGDNEGDRIMLRYLLLSYW